MINPLTYLKESKTELEKVIWPTRKETLRLTVVVIFLSVLVGAYITFLDTVFAKLTAMFLK